MKGYLALGSNLGSPLANLKEARRLLGATPGITVIASSKLYTTKPYGYLAQADFLNAVLKIETSLTPQALLAACQKVEQTLLRKREIHWGPRSIDVDILWLADATSNTATLTVPHPELTKRSFVLIPLKDVYDLPVLLGQSLDYWIKKSGNQQDVKESNEAW
ncbi:2-amino-4-hydroxy-6-hydroxymethyldihydropteridine diphosphokinase [Enterococcus nangangensis]|uniref:2-amino-4-hydroxy-6- hydroxymethyldihydropteridine diphosphokinase n=1 Tax=Enterococcus nangangensis TaxID=2559926 RepID=UPI0010F5FB41|nr:2-amino-4-hydroxy-6-hydroxymethyldihydropteridine diphosphokinase [Enterococcus nangangensis]